MDTPQTFAAALLKAGVAVVVEAKAVVAKGGLNVKNQARKNVEQTAPVENAHAQYAITYDIKPLGSAIQAEIGYDKDKRGGSLGNILEYGSMHNEPHRDLGRALDVEEPRFIDAIEAIGVRLL